MELNASSKNWRPTHRPKPWSRAANYNKPPCWNYIRIRRGRRMANPSRYQKSRGCYDDTFPASGKQERKHLKCEKSTSGASWPSHLVLRRLTHLRCLAGHAIAEALRELKSFLRFKGMRAMSSSVFLRDGPVGFGGVSRWDLSSQSAAFWVAALRLAGVSGTSSAFSLAKLCSSKVCSP